MNFRILPLVALLMSTAAPGCLDIQPSDWALAETGIATLHDRGLRGAGVTIAVLDSGFDPQHPNLRHLVDEDPGNGEVVAYRDFLASSGGIGAASDNNGHGSHILSILAARPAKADLLSDSNLQGVAPSAAYIVARVCNQETCDGSIVDDAIHWARQQGADIITLSLGGPAGENILAPLVSSNPIESAIDRALQDGIVVVASAGNEHPEADDVAFPARMEGVIAVGAVDSDLMVAEFSNRGSNDKNRCEAVLLAGTNGRCHPNQKPELVAPGVGIVGAWRDGNIVSADGTSQAAPFVAGSIALILEGQERPQDRNDVMRLKATLAASTTIPHGERGHDSARGYGLLNAEAARRHYS